MKNLGFIQKNFIDSLFFALEVAAKMKARVATFPDLIKLRINQAEDSLVWNRWITPFSTIYFGVYKGKKLIVVAHHLGPLTTKERILEWADSGTKDDSGGCNKYGHEGLPKITELEFSHLVEGGYGEVKTIDFEIYRSSFLSHLGGEHIFASDALIDPVLQAIIGPEINEFVEKHLALSTACAINKGKDLHAEKKILEFEIKDQYGWNLFQCSQSSFPEDKPVALFLTLGRPSNWGNRELSMSTSIRGQEDLGCGRFVVLNDENDDMIDIDFNPRVHWEKCLVDYSGPVADFFALSKDENKYFTQYPKNGNVMDTGEIMFKVESIKKIGRPTFFETTDCLFFLKYHIDEVKAIAPSGANAYIITDTVGPGEKVKVPVQFFKVKVDPSRRILRSKEVEANLPLLLKVCAVTPE